MARPIWKGTLGFGLVTIPVELQTGVVDARPRFRLLHRADLSPIENRRVCRRDGKPVSWDDLVKGYEYEKGQFVTLTKDDFDSAAIERSRTIEILDFVDKAQIDPRYFDVPYYVLPGKGADRSYAILREALRKAGRVGIAKFVLRTTQHLAALEVVGDALVIVLMRFADDLRDASSWSFPARDVASRELDLAVRLVESLAADWDAARYTDDYQANLMKVIKAKLRGKHARVSAPERELKGNVVDLMARLKESLARREAAGVPKKPHRASAAGRRKKAASARAPRKKTAGAA